MTQQSKDQRLEVGAPVEIEAGNVSTSSVVLSRRMDLSDRSKTTIVAGESPRASSDELARIIARERARKTRAPINSVAFDPSNSLADWRHPEYPHDINGARIDSVRPPTIVPGSLTAGHLAGPLPGSKIAAGAILLRHLKPEVLDLIRGAGGAPILRPVHYSTLSSPLKAVVAKAERMPAPEDVITADAESIVPPLSSNYTHGRELSGRVHGNENNTDIDGTIKRTIAGQPIGVTGDWLDAGKWQVGLSFHIRSTSWPGGDFNQLNAGWTFANGRATYEEQGDEPWSLAQHYASYGGVTYFSFVIPIHTINVGPQAAEPPFNSPQFTDVVATPTPHPENPCGLLLAVDYTIEEIQGFPRADGGPGISWTALAGPAGANGSIWENAESIPRGYPETFSPWHHKPGKHTAFIRLRRPFRFFVHPTQPWPEPVKDAAAQAAWEAERKYYFRFVIAAAIYATKITITDPRVRFVGLAADPEYRRWAKLDSPTGDWRRSICVP